MGAGISEQGGPTLRPHGRSGCDVASRGWGDRLSSRRSGASSVALCHGYKLDNRTLRRGWFYFLQQHEGCEAESGAVWTCSDLGFCVAAAVSIGTGIETLRRRGRDPDPLPSSPEPPAQEPTQGDGHVGEPRQPAEALVLEMQR